MQRSWTAIEFEPVLNQSALICGCRREAISQLVEVEFTQLWNKLFSTTNPVYEIIRWVDATCDRLEIELGNRNRIAKSKEIILNWGYVTSQIVQELVSHLGNCYMH